MRKIDQTSTYFWRNLPIRWARIVGVVLAVDDYFNKRVLTVDDSSGACVECLFTVPDKGDAGGAIEGAGAEAEARASTSSGANGVGIGVGVGAVVEVRGRIVEFRDERQIRITSLRPVPSTAHELVLWRKRARFRHLVLDGPPWVVTAAEARRHRRDLLRSGTPLRRLTKTVRRAAADVGRVEEEDAVGVGGPASEGAGCLLAAGVAEGRGRGRYDALGL